MKRPWASESLKPLRDWRAIQVDEKRQTVHVVPGGRARSEDCGHEVGLSEIALVFRADALGAFAIPTAIALAVLAIGDCAVTLPVVLCSSMSAINTRSSFSTLPYQTVFLRFDFFSTVLPLIYGTYLHPRCPALYVSIAAKMFL